MPHQAQVALERDACRGEPEGRFPEKAAAASAGRARRAVRGLARDAARAAPGHHPRQERVFMTMENQRIVLASHPEGWVTPDNFRLEKASVPQTQPGEVLVKNLWLSLDPYMRGRMSRTKSYVKGVEPGEVMVGQTVGEVIESKNEKLKAGDHVLTQLGWQLYGTTTEAVKVDG